MSRGAMQRTSSSVPSGLLIVGRAGLAALLAVLVLMSLLQHAPSERWWIELSRYLPYYWLLLPCALALVASFWLGRAWVLVALAALGWLGIVTMGFSWPAAAPAAAAAVASAVTVTAAAEAAAPDANRVRLMTYNIKAGFAARRPDGVAALGREVARHDPDIVVMQDADGLVAERGAPAVSQGPVFGLPHVYALGQYVVASRFALRGCAPGQIDHDNERHRTLRCTVAVRGVDLTLVTAHFVSPRGGLLATRTEGLEGRSEWQLNLQRRLAQARALAGDVRSLPRPLIVAGDLNATEKSPVVQALLAAGLRDAFSAAGRGYGFTYGQSMRAGLSFLRIDHILASPDIGIATSFEGGGTASEHRPVIADLILPAPAVRPPAP